MQTTLIIALLCLVMVSAFFSGSETSMMSLNRYRLRHLAKKKHKRARIALALLKRPDRLLSMILIGNTFANVLASAIATLIATRYLGDVGVLVATVLLTIFLLLFAEIMPKTTAALHPEPFAFNAVLLLKPLLRLLYPLVWLLNTISNALLYPLGVRIRGQKNDMLSQEELRTVVTDSADSLAQRKKHMLLGVLDLEKTTVEDVMVPRQKVVGIDLNHSLTQQVNRLKLSPYSRLPAYQDNIDNIVGVINLRKAVHFLEQRTINANALKSLIEPAYFVPETTSLQRQLINFQQQAEKMALVVDEYGVIQGLVTVEDILEEVVGEFTSGSQPCANDITQAQPDGSYIVDGSMTVRDLNRDLGLAFPTQGAKTLSGLIIEALQSLPTPHTTVLINQHPINILKVQDKAVTRAKIHPKLENKPS